MQEIFKDSGKVIKEFQEDAKDFYTTQDLVTEENQGITFESGLTLKYTKPTQLTEQDYLDDIKEAQKKLENAN